ncbi:hypothetical protein ECG_08961 [Echinococcus granulosus]|nr:hypothetical protein ECG_08961 [Echinococcus granulosus]
MGILAFIDFAIEFVNFPVGGAHWLVLYAFHLHSAAVLARVDNGAASVLMYTLSQKFSIFADVTIWDNLQGMQSTPFVIQAMRVLQIRFQTVDVQFVPDVAH